MGDRLGAYRRMAAIAALAATAALMLPAAPSQAAAPPDLQIVTSRSTYLPGDDDHGTVTLVVPQGVGLTLTNADIFAAHGVESDDRSPAGSRLFESDVLNFRDTAAVSGVATLPPGTYGFHCSVHEDNMHGTLVVQ